MSEPRAQVIQVTADALIQGGPTIWHGIHICLDGVTVGDSVVVRDSLTAGAGTVRYTFIANATDQTVDFCPCKGMQFDTGLYVDVTKSGGSMYVTVVYS